MIISQSKLLNSISNLTYYFTDKLDGNLAFHVNDDKIIVLQNHKKLSKKLKYELNSLIYMKQIHSNAIYTINTDNNFKNPPTCDALITNKVDTPLMVMVADCSPILFYDDVLKIIAVAHAGREGAFKNIVKNVVNKFTKNFNSNTKDIVVVIGANIKHCCYEVGQEIYTEAKKLSLEYAITCKKNSFYLDINEILKQQLMDAKIEEKNIEFLQDCTKCKNDKYFSYRANQKAGRFAGLIMLNS